MYVRKTNSDKSVMFEDVKKRLNTFYLAKYRFVLQPLEYIKMPYNPCSCLHRGFPSVFYQITCQKSENNCQSCSKKLNCPYYIILDNNNLIELPELKRYQTPPKPFIFEPPLKRKIYYNQKNELYFDLILFGRAMEYFPYFVKCMKLLGESGIGQNQGKYSLKEIKVFDLLENVLTDEINLNSVNAGDSVDNSISLTKLIEKYENDYKKTSEVSVSIVTPFRMKRKQIDDGQLNFRSLIKNILTRVANLATAYCDLEEFLTFPEILHEAGKIDIVKESLIWENWLPPSSKHKDSNSSKGGFYGNIVYKGEISKFLPLLRIGELMHIGKNTSFGLGRILFDIQD